MKIPSCVVWQLTKKWNCNLVKFNGQQFSYDPLNLTNLHNASASGTNDQAIGLVGRKEKGKKAFRRVFTLLQKHKEHNKVSKRNPKSQSALAYSRNDLRRGMKRLGKVVQGLPNVNERTRKLALKRLQRLHVAYRSHVKGVAVKKEEKKQ